MEIVVYKKVNSETPAEAIRSLIASIRQKYWADKIYLPDTPEITAGMAGEDFRFNLLTLKIVFPRSYKSK